MVVIALRAFVRCARLRGAGKGVEWPVGPLNNEASHGLCLSKVELHGFASNEAFLQPPERVSIPKWGQKENPGVTAPGFTSDTREKPWSSQGQGFCSRTSGASNDTTGLFNQLLFDRSLIAPHGSIRILMWMRDSSNAEGPKDHNARSA